MPFHQQYSRPVFSTTEIVTKNGYGWELYRSPGETWRNEYLVNPRFKHVFESVGLSNPDSPLVNLIDSMFSPNRRMNVKEIVEGTRQLMQANMQSCTSKKIKTPEKNMLRYFDRYLEGKHKARETLFGR